MVTHDANMHILHQSLCWFPAVPTDATNYDNNIVIHRKIPNETSQTTQREENMFHQCADWFHGFETDANYHDY